MAESIAFGIAQGLVTALSSPSLALLRLRWNFKDDLDDLRSIVFAINAVLLDAEERSMTSNLVKDWLEKLKDALYDAEDLLDDFSTEVLRKDLMSGNKLTKEVRLFFSSSNQFANGLKIGRKIKAIKARLSSIQLESRIFNLVEREHPVETPFMARRRPQTQAFVRLDEIIGRENDIAALLKLLLEFESEEDVYVIPIVGIGGLGKTALAQFVYNHEEVRDHFDLWMWVCVSDAFDLKILLKNIIKSVTNKAPYPDLEMDQLQKQLRDKIDGKKYLLVLDDVWNEEWEQWFSLKRFLMVGARGSRIIVTTRSFRVAKIMSKYQPYVLKGLSDDDALSLFKEIAFEQKPEDSTNSDFVKIGEQIVERCRGVPLVIRTIAMALSFKETVDEWLYFKENELARISQNDGAIFPTLKMSYDHLPPHLKNCFAYCRLYPKDHEIDVQTLVQFWIAQGFVKQSYVYESLEEIGFKYFEGLVERSFLNVVEKDEDEAITCKMHDLMHDLAESVAGRESSIIDSNSSASIFDKKCRHISIDFSLILLFKGKKLRTLLHSPNSGVQSMTAFLKEKQSMTAETWEFIISNCRYLRVLALNDLHFDIVPGSINKLKCLRYFDLSSNTDLKILPESICMIQNLQVLKLDHCERLEELPKKIEKLVNLTHLPCVGCYGLTHMPRGIGKLTSLQTLSRFVVDKKGSHGAAAKLSELSELNRLRGELVITNLGYVKNAKDEFKAANLKGKQHLRRLTLAWRGDNYNDDYEDEIENDEEKSLEDLQPHPNMKVLRVIGWKGDAMFPSWFSLLTDVIGIEIRGLSKFKHLPSFDQLPHLKWLNISKLTELEYMDDSDPNGGQGESESFFPSLTSLTLRQCPNMKSWWRNRPMDDDSNNDDRTVIRTSTVAFSCLSSLTIEDCPLTSMPLYPSLDKELKLVNTSSRPLKQTIQMNITPSSSSIPCSKLKSLKIESCSGLRSLFPGFQHLTYLESLSIRHCKELEYMDYSGPSESFFPSCPNMRSWWSTRPIDGENADRTVIGTSTMVSPCLSHLCLEDFPVSITPSTSSIHLSKLKSFKIENCSGLRSLFPIFQHITFLESLCIRDCKELDLSAAGILIFQNYTSLHVLQLENIPKCQHLPEWLQHLVQLKKLEIKNCSGLRSLFPVFQHLTSLEEFEVTDCKELELSAAGIQIFQDYTSLRSLHLENIPKCLHLPEWLQHLTNLQALRLYNFPNLALLPDEMRSLTTLKELYIREVPQLTERCRKDIGADWHKIAHIPVICVNEKPVQ